MKFRLSHNDYLLILGILVAIIVSITTLIKGFALGQSASGNKFKNRTAKITRQAGIHLFDQLFHQR